MKNSTGKMMACMAIGIVLIAIIQATCENTLGVK